MPTFSVALAYSGPSEASTSHSTKSFSSPSRTNDQPWGFPSTWRILSIPIQLKRVHKKTTFILDHLNPMMSMKLFDMCRY